MSKEEFTIGGIPTQGNCNIDPQDGVALQTEFVIECSGNICDIIKNNMSHTCR